MFEGREGAHVGEYLEMKSNRSVQRAMGVGMPQPPDWILAESRVVQVARGEALLNSGDVLCYVYFVRRGCVMIYSISEDGRENKVVMVPEGGVVGEMEAIAEVEGTVYTARAFEACELLRVPKEAFLKWVRSDFQACWGLTRVLAEKLYAVSLQSSQYTGSDAMERFVAQLLQIGAGRINYTRQELAEACSVSLRTVNRCVKRLLEEGAITLCRGKIEISPEQHEALEKRLNEHI